MNSPDGSLMAKKFYEAMMSSRQTSIEEQMQKRADEYNRTAGTLHLVDGYDCKICNNRGNTCYIGRRNSAMIYETYPPCKCMEIRQSIWRMKHSGFGDALEKCTFEKFRVSTEWQGKMLETAKSYCTSEDGAASGRWLFFGGAVGCGKTHICTAVTKELLKQWPAHYMSWPSESDKIKAIINDDEEYTKALNRLKEIDVLYIDDFFKPVHDDFGRLLPPTPADVRLAYKILNHRYVNRSVTIISSERYLSELMDIDDATASRIAERSRGFCLTLGREREKNYRMKKEVLL